MIANVQCNSCGSNARKIGTMQLEDQTFQCWSCDNCFEVVDLFGELIRKNLTWFTDMGGTEVDFVADDESDCLHER